MKNKKLENLIDNTNKYEIFITTDIIHFLTHIRFHFLKILLLIIYMTLESIR